jgi:hypothetical protein
MATEIIEYCCYADGITYFQLKTEEKATERCSVCGHIPTFENIHDETSFADRVLNLFKRKAEVVLNNYR